MYPHTNVEIHVYSFVVGSLFRVTALQTQTVAWQPTLLGTCKMKGVLRTLKAPFIFFGRIEHKTNNDEHVLTYLKQLFHYIFSIVHVLFFVIDLCSPNVTAVVLGILWYFKTWACQKIPCPFRDVCLGGMIRGYDSGYDSGVWFAGMIRGPWFSVSPFFTHTYPQNVSNLSNYTTRGALWSWPAVAAARVRSEGCVRFGAGTVVPLGCRCKVCAVCCLLSEWSVGFGSGTSGSKGAATGAAWGWCLEVLLSEWCVLYTMLWSGHAGERMPVEGAALRCCRASLLVLLHRWCLRVLQGT